VDSNVDLTAKVNRAGDGRRVYDPVGDGIHQGIRGGHYGQCFLGQVLRISENITGGFIYAWGDPWGIPGDDVKVSGSFPDKITKLTILVGGLTLMPLVLNPRIQRLAAEHVHW